MFNTTYNSYGPREITVKARIDEHRAPTDDSIRLYGEMREKVIDSVLFAGRESFRADNILWTLFDQPELNGVRLELRFDVNGQRHASTVYIGRHEVDHIREPRERVEAIAKMIRERIRNVIEEALVDDLFRHMTVSVAERLLK